MTGQQIKDYVNALILLLMAFGAASGAVAAIYPDMKAFAAVAAGCLAATGALTTWVHAPQPGTKEKIEAARREGAASASIAPPPPSSPR